MASQTPTQSQAQQAVQRLKFKGKLAQKGSSTDALLKRIKALHTELANLEQELVDVDTLNNVCRELIEPTLMLHKDRAVKAFVACCLADMLRLYAPNAPFTASELKDIFQFFIRQLTTAGGIGRPNGPQYAEYFYLLENLSNVKSAVLICDLPSADEMMAEVFRGFFDLIRPEMSKNVEICMADILVQLIDECVTLPTEVLEILLANFNPKAVKNSPAAHQMAVEVCLATTDRLQKNVAQYFTEVIVAASKEDDADERLESLNTAHSLIVQINRSVPALLLNVIPQMEEELRAEEVQLRTLATQVLGQMFAEKPAKSGGGGGDLARKYPNTWRAWLGRSKDRSSSLRVVWVEAMKALLINHPELGTDLTPLIKEKLVEPDEKVRAALCRVFSVLDYETALHHVEKSVLLVIAERCKDKKTSVRADAQHALARMFDMAYSEIESHDPAATQQFAWIPGAILKCLFAGDKELYQQTTATMAKYILPLPQRAEDEAVWVNRLLLVMKHLDDSATKALQRLTGLVQTRPSPYDAVLDGCEAYNGGIIDEDEEGVKTRLAHAIKICASQFAEPLKAANDLQTFAKMNEVRIYKLIKLCMDPQTDLKSYLKNHAEAVRRIEAASPAIVETMTTFLRNGSYPFVNRSSLPTLVRRLAQPRADFTASQLAPLSQSQSQSQTQSASLGISSASDVDAFKTSAKLMLEFVAKRCPAMYKAHVPELAKAISEEDNPVLVEVCLRALAAVAKDDPSAAPSDRRTLQRVRTLVSLGTPSQAKYAARFLALASRSRGERTGKGKGADATVALDELLEELARALPKTTGERLVAHLSAIAQFFKHVPEASEDKADSIVREVLQGILMKPRSKDGPPALDEDAAEDWVEDDQMDAQLRAKLLGLDILTKRSVAFAETDNATELAVPVFRLLWQTLSDGEPRKNGASAAERSRMRLQAALCLLKLARRAAYDSSIGREFARLAFATQDECFQVRARFLHALLKDLARRRLSPRYNALCFLVAFDPERENREMVAHYVVNTAKAVPNDIRVKHFDMSFARFIHLLAHHPDFSREPEEIQQFTRYIDFFLDCLATPESVSFLYYLASRLKGVRDSESQGHSENLYMLSELAQHVIKTRAHAHNWNIETYPAKVQLPSDIFKPLPNREVQKEIYDRQYLSNEVIAMIGELSKPHKSPKKRVPKDPSEQITPRKRAPRTPGSAKRSKRRRKDETSDEEVSSDDSDDENAADSDSSVSSMGQEDAEDEETAAGDGEQALGRGARAKAKARNEKREKIARRKAKLEKAKAHTKGTPGKATRRDSDGDTAMDGSSDLSEDEADE